MIKFDLERALAGDRVVTRYGSEVSQLTRFESDSDWFLVGVVNGSIMRWNAKGETFENNSEYYIFMAPKKLSGFVNVYEDGDVGQVAHRTKKSAVFCRSDTKTCIACIDLSQFEEGHGLCE